MRVVVGYQSKTINTVTAGTLLRSLGYFEQRLAALGRQTHRTYQVSWQDYSAGAPITAQMLAGKIDIGSMGDYPMLINGARSAKSGNDRTSMISVTGYHPLGALNMVVAGVDSPIASLSELRGKQVSTSIGSAAHGTLVQALRRDGLSAADISVQNQDPAVGASALRSGGGGRAGAVRRLAGAARVREPGQAAELWPSGATATRPAATASCLPRRWPSSRRVGTRCARRTSTTRRPAPGGSAIELVGRRGTGWLPSVDRGDR